MVSGIRFFASSGAFGNTIASLYAAGKAEPGGEIFNFEIGATNSPNRLGFFGLNGAPNSPVIVGQFQDRSHRTDADGNDLGILVNVKFTGAMTAEISGVPFTASFQTIPPESGTLLLRFTEPNGTNVVTQQAVFRAIDLDAGSGAPNVADLANGVTVQAFQLPDTDGFAGDTAWTLISDTGADLTLEDQISEQVNHDYHIAVSASAGQAGRKIDFAFYVQLEFL
jgi:hypothetical protein